MLAHFLNQLVVEHVALGDGEHASLVGKVGVKLLQLVEQDVVFLLDVVGIGRNHEEQHGVTLDVAQEAQTKSAALARTLDDARNVDHYK